MQQLVAEGQQPRHQLRVARQALRGRNGALGHALLQRLPVLAQAREFCGLPGRHAVEPGGRGLQRLVQRIAHGRPARRELRIAAEQRRRQAAVRLREAHGLAQLLQGRHGARLRGQGLHLADPAVQIQASGQGHHHQGDAAQDQELVRQAQAVEQLHNIYTNVSNCSKF